MSYICHQKRLSFVLNALLQSGAESYYKVGQLLVLQSGAEIITKEGSLFIIKQGQFYYKVG